MTSHMQYYTFSIAIGGIKKITDELEDKLWEAGCMDALISVSKGIVKPRFHKTRPKL